MTNQSNLQTAEEIKPTIFDTGKGADFSECGKYRYRLIFIFKKVSLFDGV